MRSICFIKFLFLSVLYGAVSQIVKVRQGVISGKTEISAKGRHYMSFEGIPYSTPPIGKNRFMEVNDLQPWVGVWNATRTSSSCMQYEPFSNAVIGQEDCLYLNVYSPDLRETASLPVLFFIHGGAFMYGTGSIYGPQRLMDWDMVVVTVNYRLGPLGFLSTGDRVVPGNAGLKDQYHAMLWVKDNIKMFGGNPDNIILYGNSAGASSVHYHFVSPRHMKANIFSRGLFSSGSALSSWSYQQDPGDNSKVLASLVGCPTSNTKEMVHCLQKIPGDEIVTAQSYMLGWKGASLFTPFTPSMEPEGTENPLVASHPSHATAIGKFSKPILASVTSEEGLYPAAYFQSDSTFLPELNDNWENLASSLYQCSLPLEKRRQVTARIKEYYFNNQSIGQETYPQLVQSLGDRLFYSNIGKFLKMAASRSDLPIYAFRYSFRGEKSLSNMIGLNNNDYGVSHSDDLFRVFVLPHFELNRADDLAMIDLLINIIYSFATDGLNSTNGRLTKSIKLLKTVESNSRKKNEIDFEWLPVDKDSKELNLLEISAPNNLKMMSVKNFGNVSFWDSLELNEEQEF
ncbi:venom carboxylesterase-6-like [Leptidea sinapis]|uniref:venom carboxylesterase-6-like n=1 Tax=Leptidea sinapis TaxID=189913 RepID=UPI00212CDCB3|nr:venom carboxylesterase-6-like [Leptidea sinapis]